MDQQTWQPSILSRCGDVERSCECASANSGDRCIGQSAGRTGWSVKDSFHCLDLNELGFTPLFDAEWIAAKSPIGASAARFVRFALAAGQQRGRSALLGAGMGGSRYSCGAVESVVPGLLSDPDIHFVWTCDHGATVGGGILIEARASSASPTCSPLRLIRSWSGRNSRALLRRSSPACRSLLMTGGETLPRPIASNSSRSGNFGFGIAHRR